MVLACHMILQDHMIKGLTLWVAAHQGEQLSWQVCCS